jgi:hypothetical protein
MKLKTKKLIAREFIILCIVCSTGIIAYFLFLANNIVNQKKLENLNKVLAIKVGQLNITYLQDDEPTCLPLKRRITESCFVAIIAFTVIMLFRYIYYLISWSITTLKKKEI